MNAISKVSNKTKDEINALPSIEFNECFRSAFLRLLHFLYNGKTEDQLHTMNLQLLSYQTVYEKLVKSTWGDWFDNMEP